MDLSLREQRADANPEPRIIASAEGLLDAFETVVPTSAPRGAKAVAPHRERYIIHDNHEIRGRRPKYATEKLDEHRAAEIHVGERLDERHSGCPYMSARGQRLPLFAPRAKMPNVGQVVDNPPADVVTSPFVLAARISQAQNDFHYSSVPSPSSAFA